MAAWNTPTPTPDTTKLHRDDPQTGELLDPIMKCLDIVKEKPAETIGLTLMVFMVQFVFSFAINIIVLIGTATGGLMVRMVGRKSMMLAQFLSLGMLSFSALLSAALGIIFQSLTMGAMQIMWLRLVRGQDATFNHLTETKRFIVPLILTNLLVFLATMAGLMALVIPGYIVMFGLVFTTSLVVDKNIRGVEALKASWALTDGHKLNLFLLCLALGVLNMIGMMACGVGMIVTIPISTGAIVMYYNNIAHPGNAYMTSQEQNVMGNNPSSFNRPMM